MRFSKNTFLALTFNYQVIKLKYYEYPLLPTIITNNNKVGIFPFLPFKSVMLKPMKQPYVAPEKTSTIIRKFIFRILSYPYSIIKKYNNYNIRVGEMANELKDEELNKIRNNNGKLLLVFIYFPIFLGLALCSYSVYSHWFAYLNFWERLNAPFSSAGFFSIFTKISKKIEIILNCPIRKNDYFPVIYGYLISLLGSRFLSLNPVFKEEEKIASIFSSLGYIDGEGKPWQITWTPDSIMIISFNCDPIQLCSNTRFWSTINFPPGNPTVSKNNANKFIVTRAYELTANLIFTYED